jgi:hypothetical protein
MRGWIRAATKGSGLRLAGGAGAAIVFVIMTALSLLREPAPATLVALERLRQSGRKLILVTGRDLPDLLHVWSLGASIV